MFVMAAVVLFGSFSVTAFAAQQGVSGSPANSPEDQARLERQQRFEKRLEQIKSGEYKADSVPADHKTGAEREEIDGKKFRD